VPEGGPALLCCCGSREVRGTAHGCEVRPRRQRTKHCEAESEGVDRDVLSRFTREAVQSYLSNKLTAQIAMKIERVHMRKLIFSLVTAFVLSTVVSAAELKTDQQRFSYIIGMQIGQQIKDDGIILDENAFMQAIRDAASGAPPKLTQEEIRATVENMKEERAKLAAQAGEKNKQEGEKFLAANRSKPGVEVLPSGLQYQVLHAGTGAKPAATDTVEVNYRGTLLDGTEFDSSYKRGQPATFPVNGVIQGWQQALQMMNEGSKWQLFIPADLAYGSSGAGGVIGPNATLVFEVELLKIKK